MMEYYDEDEYIDRRSPEERRQDEQMHKWYLEAIRRKDIYTWGRGASEEELDADVAMEEMRKRRGLHDCVVIAWEFARLGWAALKENRMVRVGDNLYRIFDLCGKHGVVEPRNEKANMPPDTLTVTRLTRLFAKEISAKIKLDNVKSTLYRRFGVKGSKPEFTFPCAEYFVTGEDFQLLKRVYKRMDRETGTKFAMKMRAMEFAHQINTNAQKEWEERELKAKEDKPTTEKVENILPPKINAVELIRVVKARELRKKELKEKEMKEQAEQMRLKEEQLAREKFARELAVEIPAYIQKKFKIKS